MQKLSYFRSFRSHTALVRTRYAPHISSLGRFSIIWEHRVCRGNRFLAEG